MCVEEEEEEQKAWQAEMLQRKREHIQRMEANRKSFEMQMAAMNKKLEELSVPHVPQSGSKLVGSGTQAGEPSGKINKNVLKLTKANLKRLAEDTDEDTDEDEDKEDEDDCDDPVDAGKKNQSSKQSPVCSRLGMERNSVSSIRSHVDSVSQDGLGHRQVGPTKAQLAARKGLTFKLPKFSGKPAQWPLFYAAYNASNDACGYMNYENMMRLQVALEGDALELV